MNKKILIPALMTASLLVAAGFGLALEAGLDAPEPGPVLHRRHRLDRHAEDAEVAGHRGGGAGGA